MNYQKYTRMYHPVPLENREWCDKVITHAPIWCSVDLRDGNQALYSPMTIDEKIEFFEYLVKLGFKEIEVGFPAASGTEYDFVRRLIDEHRIPDDVTIQVLTQAREHIIEKTVEALQGVKNAIIHLYNSTSTLQREVVFHKDMAAIKKLAIDGAKLVKELVDSKLDGNIRYEYSPESFTCTEPEYAVEVVNAVNEIFCPTPERKVIINLPSTIEVATANIYADQIEYMCKNLKNRENLIISVHAHNDRGTGVASSELAMLAGADRVEGTLFGNGERTGNADIVTIALNMFSQGVDPELDLSNIDEAIAMFEKFNKMNIHSRHPYAGDMAYVAFSGSHQDAIKKSFDMFDEHPENKWANPYLTIDPADIGRKYEPIMINSQSGKGGVSYVMAKKYGYIIPKNMLTEFSGIINDMSDEKHTVLENSEIHRAFKDIYTNITTPMKIASYNSVNTDSATTVDAVIEYNGDVKRITGTGNGPLDALCVALRKLIDIDFEICEYTEHALERKSTSKAATYIAINDKDDHKIFWGVGVHENINTASNYALVSAVNRMLVEVM